MIWDGGLFSGDRVPPDLVAAGSVPGKVTAQPSQLPGQLDILYAATATREENGREVTARTVSGRVSPAALSDAINAEAT